jgi:aminoglycoside 6-adenylyltransferase
VDHDAVLREVVQWVERDSNVRALVLEGSVGRGDVSVDEWSDLDVRLYVAEPRPLLERREWFEQFGEVLVVEALENPGWYPTRLVYYVDGKIDFMIAPLDALRDRRRFGRRVQVLVDKDGLTTAIEQGEPPSVTVPDAAEFLRCVNEFYAAALVCARMLVRDEPVKAKFRDWDMKTRLFEMIAWDHRARYGSARDVRPFGTSFRTWVDADVAEALDRCWSDLRVDASIRALHATVALFRTTGDRAASAIDLQPFAADAVVEEIARIAKAASP